MPPTITDTTTDPIVLYSGATTDPFNAISVDDPIVFENGVFDPDAGILTITLSSPSGSTGNLGTLGQTAFPGVATYNASTKTLTENTFIGPMNPTDPRTILKGTTYTAPITAAGSTTFVNATVSYTHLGGDTVTDPTPIQLEIIAPPAPTVTSTAPYITTQVAQGQTYTPFPSVVVTEPTSIQTPVPEVITIRLGSNAVHDVFPFPPGFDAGSISDPNGGGSFDPATATFTETVTYTPGQPDAAQAVINRLLYAPPVLANGLGNDLQIDVNVNDSNQLVEHARTPYESNGLPVGAQDITNPLVATGPAQSVSAGDSISPLAGIQADDNDGIEFQQGLVSTGIVVTDNGVATDADGILSGPGLTKTGVGTYAMATTIHFVIAASLQALKFTTTAEAANQGRTDVFTVTLTDPNTGLSTTAAGGTLTTYGPNASGTSPVTIGTGPDALALLISNDAYQGNAQFTISVDGIQQGGIQTATANHSDGEDQAYTIQGAFGTSAHIVTVDFLNDNGGYGPTDRNLYVDGAAINGVAIPNSTFVEYAGGPQSLGFIGNDLSPASPTVVGNGPDIFTFKISEDAYQGDAQFTFSIDGQQIGGIQTTSALHGLGQDQTFLVEGKFGDGPHTATLNFLNDNGGYGATDRNLYADSVSYNGTASTTAPAALYSSGPADFAIPAHTFGSDTLTIGLAEDAYQGDAVASISLDGVNLGTPTVSFLNSSGTTQEFTYSGDFGGVSALHTLDVSFLNDNGGFGPTDRNLYVKDLSFDGTTLPDASTLYSNGTVSTTFQNGQVIAAFPSQH